MLDYMKNENNGHNEIEQNNEEVSLQEVLSDNDDVTQKEDLLNSDQQESVDQEFLTTSVENTSVKRNTMILMCLFVVGGISLFLMTKNIMPNSANAANSNAKVNNEIELAIAKLSGIKAEIFDKMDDIANKFDELSNIEQVGVAYLQRNPFSLQPAVSSMIDDSQLGSSSNVGKYLRLDSIIQSSDGNICMIDGKVYKEGDKIGSYLIKKVERDLVRLDAGGSEKILKIN